MKANKFIFNVGHNNKTKECETGKIRAIMDSNKIQGYSIIKCMGVWQCNQEDSVIIEAINTPESPINEEKAQEIRGILKQQLNQEAVLLSRQSIDLL